MATRSIIRQGDQTSHGGMVLEGHRTATIHGIPIAGRGHMTHCPKCKGVFPIAEGVFNHIIYGIQTAVEGMQTTCGAILIASQNSHTIDIQPYAQPSPDTSLSPASFGSSAFNHHHAYDEQIKFLLHSGAALAGMPYLLTLDDGEQITGTTDAHGKTARVTTAEPRVITNATLQPNSVFCCARQADNAAGGGDNRIDIELNGITTHANDLGSSIKEHQIEENVRTLTAGEIELAKKIFAHAIDYTRVKVHNGAYMIGAGNNAMTPNGEMYFPKKFYATDFSVLSDSLKIWFIHEMVHVWQYQLGYGMKWAGIKIQLQGGYGYDTGQEAPRAYIYHPTKDANKSMADFNMEQQGDLIAHYFAAVFLSENVEQHSKHINNLPFLQKVLDSFLRNPSDVSLLPHSTKFDN